MCAGSVRSPVRSLWPSLPCWQLRKYSVGGFTGRSRRGLLLWTGVSLGDQGRYGRSRPKEGLMLSKARIGITLLSLVVLAGSAGLHPSAVAASAPALVTNDNDGATSYLRYDGTSDATTTACSSGRRA